MAATNIGPLADGEAPALPSHIVTRMLAEVSTREGAGQIPLFAERRLFLKRRWRGVAADGTEFGFDLESRLKIGGVIHRTETADYVVWQEPEPVYVVRLASVESAALLGWQIGNLHMAVEIKDGEIRAQHDSAVRQLLEREGHAFMEKSVVFQPLRVAAHAS